MNTPNIWLMEPDRLQQMHRRMVAAVRPSMEALEQRRQAAAAQLRQVSGKVAVLPVCGVIEQKMSEWGYWCGSASTELIGECLDRLEASKEVGAVVLDFDSPGGGVYGVQELGDKIFGFRDSKPIYGMVNSCCCSAAYWLASQCTQIVSTPGGDCGSVGVFAVHVDVTGAMEQGGVKVSIIKAGKYKAEGQPYEPLTPEAKDYLQATVDDVYGKFASAVGRGRGVSAKIARSPEFGEGRAMSADKALAAGLIDKVMTLPQLILRLGGEAPVVSDGRRTQMMRLRHEHQKRKALLLVGTVPLWADDEPPAKEDAPEADDDEPFDHTDKMAADEPDWETVNKDQLPDEAHADEENREYAHHWIKGGTKLDDEGRWKDGEMLLHSGGLRACKMQADEDGASDDVKEHLADHMDACNMDDATDDDMD